MCSSSWVTQTCPLVAFLTSFATAAAFYIASLIQSTLPETFFQTFSTFFQLAPASGACTSLRTFLVVFLPVVAPTVATSLTFLITCLGVVLASKWIWFFFVDLSFLTFECTSLCCYFFLSIFALRLATLASSFCIRLSLPAVLALVKFLELGKMIRTLPLALTNLVSSLRP